jgi:hypothetical protein
MGDLGKLPITSYLLPITFYLLPLTHYLLPFPLSPPCHKSYKIVKIPPPRQQNSQLHCHKIQTQLYNRDSRVQGDIGLEQRTDAS